MAIYDNHFPIELAERSLRLDSGETDPAALVRGELARTGGEQRAAVDGLLTSVAQARHQIDRTREDLRQADCREAAAPAVAALEIIAANLANLLEAHQVRIEDLAGRRWSAEMRDEIDVRGHSIREDLDEPRIAHMELPVVYRDDRLIARGAAIVEAPRRQ